MSVILAYEEILGTLASTVFYTSALLLIYINSWWHALLLSVLRVMTEHTFVSAQLRHSMVYPEPKLGHCAKLNNFHTESQVQGIADTTVWGRSRRTGETYKNNRRTTVDLRSQP